MNTREVAVSIGGKMCSISSDDDYLQHIGKEFEPYMVKLFRCVAQGSRVAFDVGANIGCTAVLFSDLCEKVYAFEPSPSTFAYLSDNVDRNARRNVTLHNCGLGAEAGTSTITFAANNRSGAFVSDREKANADHKSEQISIRTLDEMADSLYLQALDFVKIDVEGFEGHVLRGGAATLERFRPVVVLELNHWCLNAFQRVTVPEFFDQLRATFPILLAVDGDRYLDLHSADESYAVMYHHILHMRFANIVGAYDEAQLARFREQYRPGFGGDDASTGTPPGSSPVRASLPRRVVRRAVRSMQSFMHRN